jgi:hypothetical protein
MAELKGMVSEWRGEPRVGAIRIDRDGGYVEYEFTRSDLVDKNDTVYVGQEATFTEERPATAEQAGKAKNIKLGELAFDPTQGSRPLIGEV